MATLREKLLKSFNTLKADVRTAGSNLRLNAQGFRQNLPQSGKILSDFGKEYLTPSKLLGGNVAQIGRQALDLTKNPLARNYLEYSTRLPGSITQGLTFGLVNPLKNQRAQTVGGVGGDLIGSMYGFGKSPATQAINKVTNPIALKAVNKYAPALKPYVGGLAPKFGSAVANVGQGLLFDAAQRQMPTLPGIALDAGVGFGFGTNTFDDALKATRSNFRLDDLTRKEIETAEEMLRNPDRFLGEVRTTSSTKKEAIKEIKRLGLDTIARIGSKYLPNKEFSPNLTPNQIIKKLIDLSDKNKLANVNLDGGVYITKDAPAIKQRFEQAIQKAKNAATKPLFKDEFGLGRIKISNNKPPQDGLDDLSKIDLGLGLMGGSQATGYKNATKFSSLLDKKPRFEIDDSGAKFSQFVLDNFKKKYPERMLKIGDVLEHEELFKNYPQVKDVEVIFIPASGKPFASYSPEKNSITINGDIKNFSGWNKEFKSTLLHEIQHAIQEIEGFARGGSPGQFIRKRTPDEDVELQNLFLKKEKSNLTPSEQKRFQELSVGGVDGMLNSYQRLSGELEARAVQRRMDMPANQRGGVDSYAAEARATTGTTNPNDFITRFDGGTSASVVRKGDTLSFKQPYGRGDLAKLETELDMRLGTEDLNYSGSWKGQLPAREYAYEGLAAQAREGVPGAAEELKNVDELMKQIELARSTKEGVKKPIVDQVITKDTIKQLKKEAKLNKKLGIPNTQPPKGVETPRIDRTQLTGKQLSTPNAKLGIPNTQEIPGVGAYKQSKNTPTLDTSKEAQSAAEVSTLMGGGKGGIKGMTDDVADQFRTWVNTRQASDISALKNKQTFTKLDDAGIEGIIGFQKGKNSYPELRDYFNKRYFEVVKSGVEMKYQTDYVPQLWKNSQEEVEQVLGKRFSMKPGFTMEKLIESYEKGIKGGLQPKFTKVSELAQWYEGRVSKTIADNKFFNFLEKDSFIQPGSKAPRGWVTLDPDRFPKRTVGTPDGSYAGTYKAPPELAKLINNYLQQPDGVLSDIANFASGVKQIVLTAGVPKTALNFHGVNILARHTLAAKNPITELARGLTYLARPSLAKKSFFSQLDKAKKAASYGLTISSEDFKLEGVQRREATNVIAKAAQKVSDFNQKHFEKQLFGEVIPALKLKYWDDIYQGLRKDGISEKEAGRTAADIANNIYGGINSEQIGRSRDLQNFIRSTVLAGDWAETQLKIGGNLAKSLLNPRDPKGKAYRTFVRNFVGMYVGANVINKLSSGHYMWENDSGNTFNIQIGYTEDGKKRYLRPFGTAVDMFRLPYDVALSLAKGDPSQVFRVVRNRLSVPLGVASALLFNVDYRGNAIYGRDKYGNQLTPTQSALGITGELSRLGTPPQIKAGLDRISGRTGNEEFLAQLVEAPLRYQGGAYSNLQKKLDPTAKAEGLRGKELFDFREKLKGQRFGKNQLAKAKTGVSGVDSVLKDKEERAKITEAKTKVLETGKPQRVGSKYFYVEDGSVKTIDTDITLPKYEPTGMEEVDKKALSKYKSELTKVANTVVDMLDQKLISLDQAEQALKYLEQQKTLSKSTGKKTISDAQLLSAYKKLLTAIYQKPKYQPRSSLSSVYKPIQLKRQVIKPITV